MKRILDIAVISDVHLGNYGCHANELLCYLKSIQPEVLVINGDFIDMWRFRKKRFPSIHAEVVQQVFQMAKDGTKIYYIIGSQDDHFRQYIDYSSGNIHFREKVVLQLKGKRVGIFHGHEFDLSIHYSKAITKLGEKGYQTMIFLNRLMNNIRRFMGWQPRSFAKKMRNRVGEALRYIQKFEELALKIAAKEKYDYIICGHIHRPLIRSQEIAGKPITYLNAGDWVENLTALEYRWGRWRIHEYNELDYGSISKRLQVKALGSTAIERKLNPFNTSDPEEWLQQLDRY
ncbi:MAG: UDP-2,3-diacylglucosamine diphosphatase [Bacteroidota bacterium]